MLAVLAQGADADDELAEVEELARTAGVEPVGRIVQHRQRPARRTYVGKGKLEELKEQYAASGAESLLVDDELDPVQQRYLEDALKTRVIDRPQLILDIFAQHAVSAEGKLQVELAQLEYNLPRMRGLWQHLERLGGGVGTRGPGESQLETDRRLARRRVALLKRRLREVERQRTTRRKERRRTETPTVALAGYTNVGKSTLLNALTGAEVSVENRLFETLDPTTRGFEHDGRRYLVTDTVGFIRRLPHQLVEGFASTLEETLVADLVLHVVDASVEEERLREMVRAVEDVLHEIGATEAAGRDRAEQDRPRRPARPAPPREPLPERAAGVGGNGRGHRGAAGVPRRPLRRPLGDGAPPHSVRGGRAALGAVRPRRSDRRAARHGGGRGRRGAAAAARAPPVRAVPRCRSDPARGAGERLIELPVMRLRDDAVLPARAYADDAGLDLSACERVELAPGARALVPTGLAVAIPPGHAGFVQPRSGLAARHGVSIVNTPGLVDAGYRGELLVNLLNTDPEEAFVVEPGMRIAQLVVLAVPAVEPIEVDELPGSERGARGFGSSRH